MLRKLLATSAIAASLLAGAVHPAVAAPGTAAAPALAKLQEEPDLRQECSNRSAEAARVNGWTRSRFEYCHHTREETNLYATNGTYLGFFHFDLWTLGFAYDGSRRVDYVTSIENLALASQLNHELTWLTVNYDSCSGMADIACSGPRERTGASNDWYTNPRMDTFTVTSPDGTGTGTFKFVTHTMRLNFIVEYRDGRTHPYDEWATAVAHVRFDNAGPSLGNGKHKGTVFTDHVPTLNLPLTGAAIDAEARHVDDAQNHPERTFPSRVGKVAPGKTTPLHRLMDSSEIDKNHTASVNICRNIWGPEYTSGGQDCDEYPFKSTYEGSWKSTGNQPFQWNGSARPIDAGDNQRGGTKLANFYGENRILDNDPFYVRVTPS
ncbi:NucA/NucB deoxyribonuclease domain-containing protein [Lentzea sp. CA-135723]|uniref:NucA/NucB deoxyribonuclease domain-containing protein n=1 Tax=Lentzea sp. CA-135723 TaxID=3239950 RepID=UPI003D8BF9D0